MLAFYDFPERHPLVTTTHKSRFVITPSNGWTAIRNAILASLARYRALRNLANCPVAYQGLKIITSLALRFPDFHGEKQEVENLDSEDRMSA